ncbi:hypothetical protein SK128_018482, partial [Halocaridina rubra]
MKSFYTWSLSSILLALLLSCIRLYFSVTVEYRYHKFWAVKTTPNDMTTWSQYS